MVFRIFHESVAVKIPFFIFLDINILSAKLGDERVTITRIIAETYVINFSERGRDNVFLQIMDNFS